MNNDYSENLDSPYTIKSSITDYETSRTLKEAGFIKLSESKPGFYYFKGYKIKSREFFQKHKIMNFPEYDSNISTEENIRKLGWNKFYNCGNSSWVLEK